MYRSLLVGLTSVDSVAYHGWTGENGCWGCELDVDNVERILRPLSYDTKILKTKSATSKAILAGLNEAATKCQPGDLFVFYFSAHGGQQPDGNGDELDGRDETLVAYDREVTDDELNAIWPKFQAGVRIFMLSDSCNSGTNYKLMKLDIGASTPMRMFVSSSTGSEKKRAVRATMKAQMIHFGGCRDGATSAGYESGGVFTQAVCNVWNGGTFAGDYPEFYEAVKSEVTGGQAVQFSKYGPVDESFLRSRPFAAARNGGAAPTGSGSIRSVRCVLDINENHLAGIRTAIKNEASTVLLEAVDDALSQRPGSASASCTGSSGGGVSCTGSVSISW